MSLIFLFLAKIFFTAPKVAQNSEVAQKYKMKPYEPLVVIKENGINSTIFFTGKTVEVNSENLKNLVSCLRGQVSFFNIEDGVAVKVVEELVQAEIAILNESLNCAMLAIRFENGNVNFVYVNKIQLNLIIKIVGKKHNPYTKFELLRLIFRNKPMLHGILNNDELAEKEKGYLKNLLNMEDQNLKNKIDSDDEKRLQQEIFAKSIGHLVFDLSVFKNSSSIVPGIYYFCVANEPYFGKIDKGVIVAGILSFFAYLATYFFNQKKTDDFYVVGGFVGCAVISFGCSYFLNLYYKNRILISKEPLHQLVRFMSFFAISMFLFFAIYVLTLQANNVASYTYDRF